jgi:hypothetical protein
MVYIQRPSAFRHQRLGKYASLGIVSDLGDDNMDTGIPTAYSTHRDDRGTPGWAGHV